MSLLPVKTRQLYFKKLCLGEYNEDNIRKLQKKYMRPADADGIYGTNTDRLLRHVYNCSLVKNFKPEEFRCPCGRCTGYPTYIKQVELNHIQTIRDHYNNPMTITSGLRCAYENNRVGGIANSGHKTGYAVDFYMPGVTDTVPNRNKSLSYIKTLPNHKFTYGAYMVDSDGAYREASSMGNAMHTETKKPDVTTASKVKNQTNGQKIASKGWEFAWHNSKNKNAKYPSGYAKKAYKEALNKYFGKVRKWQDSAKKGASCDVFIATCIRAAGIDKNAPRGLGRSYFNKSDKFKRVKVTPESIKNGDIISIIWKNGNPHWAMAYNGKVLEASLNGWYPKLTNTLKSRLSKSGKQNVVVYRAK